MGAYTKSAIATYGVATTATTILTGTTIIGGFIWAGESIDKATKAYELFEAGDKLAAAEILISLASNIKSLGTADLASDLQNWMDAGQPIYGSEFSKLVKDVYSLSKEAKKALEDT